MTCKRSPICDGIIHSAHVNACRDECKPCPDCKDTTSDVEGMVKRIHMGLAISLPSEVVDDVMEHINAIRTRAHEQGHEQGKVVGRKEARDAVKKLWQKVSTRKGSWDDDLEDAISAIDDIDREGK